jgi:Arc/MetJ family transcription regulator
VLFYEQVASGAQRSTLPPYTKLRKCGVSLFPGEFPMQRTNVALDEKLIREGMRLFKKKTKKELIDFALREIIRREKAKGILALEGKINWEGDLQEMRKERFADLG